ncbi:MAG: response regulator [Intestinibacillus sp.]
MYKVLIVDDENFIRRGLVSCMDWQAWGCELIGAAENGEQAMELVRQNKPDIVISDINMDKMSGLELVEQLSFQYPEIKAILFTGIYDFNNVYNAIKFDVVDLILKPTSPGRIQQALTKAIYQIENERASGNMRALIKRQSEQNLKLKQTMLLSNLAEGSTYGEGAAEALRAVGLTLNHFVIVTLLFYGPQGQSPAAFRESEQTITGYINLLFEDSGYYCVFTGTRSFHILLNFDEATERTHLNVRALCADLSKTIDNLTEYYCTIGISALHSDPTQLHEAMSESIGAANYAAYDKDNASIVEYSHMPRLSSDTIGGLKSYLDQLSDAIERMQPEAAHTVLLDIAAYFSEHRVPFEEVRSVGILVADLCIRHLWDYNSTVEDVFSTRHELYKNLLQCMHADELLHGLEAIVELTIRNLSALCSGSRSMIDQVESYIRRSYQDELSLDKIAARYHISPGYLSRLFKSKKDVSLTTYIQNIRIEKAKELIASTDLRTYEIAAAVGIPDPVYFSKTFKKATGIRVRDYRAQARGAAE